MEREGRTEEKKIEEEERQHTVRPKKTKMREIAGTVYVKQEKVEVNRTEREIQEEKRVQSNRQDQRQKNMQLPDDCSLHLMDITSHIVIWILLFYNKTTSQISSSQDP